MSEVNSLGRNELKQLRPDAYLAETGFDDGHNPGSERAGNFVTAACITLEDGGAPPQEFLTIYEAIKQCLELAADHSDPQERLRIATEEAIEVTESLLQKKLTPAVKAWVEECLPHVHTEEGIETFLDYLQAVAEQYSVTMSLKHGGA